MKLWSFAIYSIFNKYIGNWHNYWWGLTIPAFFAASTPFGASSKTSTLDKLFGGEVNLLAATRYMSGLGLPCSTPGSSLHTACSMQLKRFPFSFTFSSYCTLAEPVATASGTPCLCRWWIRRSAPARERRNRGGGGGKEEGRKKMGGVGVKINAYKTSLTLQLDDALINTQITVMYTQLYRHRPL